MEFSEIPQTPIIRECNNRGCFWFCIFFCNQIKKSAFQSLHDKFYSAWLMLVQCRLRAWPWQSLLTTSLEKVNYNEFVIWPLKRRIGYRWETKVKKKRKASLKWHQGDNGARYHTTTTWIGIHWGLDDTFWSSCSKSAFDTSTGTRWLDSLKNQPQKMYRVMKKYDDLKNGCFHSAAI